MVVFASVCLNVIRKLPGFKLWDSLVCIDLNCVFISVSMKKKYRLQCFQTSTLTTSRNVTSTGNIFVRGNESSKTTCFTVLGQLAETHMKGNAQHGVDSQPFQHPCCSNNNHYHLKYPFPHCYPLLNMYSCARTLTSNAC